MQPQNQKATISVSEPVLNTSETFNYVTYLISGSDSKGPFDRRRRYRDFHLLREKLIQRMPGLYIPPIASKKLTGNMEEKFVESRKNFLNYFCTKISERAYLYNSDVFQMFLRNDQQFEKTVKQLPKVDYEQLCLVYEKNFTQLTQKVSSAQLQIMTQTDYDFMKKAEKKLQRIRDQFKQAIDAKNEYEKQFNACMSSVVPTYEQKFLLKYVDDDRQNLLLNKNEQFSDKLKQYKEYTAHNPLQDYVELISYELREMRAFVEAIDNRKKIEELKNKTQQKRRDTKQQIEKLKVGKTTFKSVFSSGTKVEQIKELEQRVEKSQKLEQAMGKMIYLMNASTYSDIVEYKKRRAEEYPKNVKQISKKQIKQMDMYGKLLQIPLQ